MDTVTWGFMEKFKALAVLCLLAQVPDFQLDFASD